MRRDRAVGTWMKGESPPSKASRLPAVAVHGPPLRRPLPRDDRHRNRLACRLCVAVGAGCGPKQRAEGECGD